MTAAAGPLLAEIAACLAATGVAKWGVATCPSPPWPHAPALPRAISLAIALSPEIIGPVADGPTPAYLAEYRRLNRSLWEAAERLAAVLRTHGAVAEPLRPTIGPTGGSTRAADAAAASTAAVDVTPTDTEAVDMTAAGVFAHKTAATQAGLGWIGKTALFISPHLGPWLRLATVFTDADLPTGQPMTESGCAACRICVDACPAGAGHDVQWRAGMPRNELLDVVACIHENERHDEAGGLCGICVAVCPFGRRRLRR